MVKIAVIGAGVFGATVAVDCARAGAQVDLYEAKPDLLGGATSHCQARLHAGYHYPRSDSTAIAARDAYPEFAARYPEAVYSTQHHYVIADDSQVNGSDYLAFCDRLKLPYEIVESPYVHHAQVCIQVPEAFVNTGILRRLLRRDLAEAGVNMIFNTWTEPDKLPDYDLVIVTTYGQPWNRPLRYEICEIAIIELGRYGEESFVIMDGPFISLDPVPNGHMLYGVAHSVHHANVGYKPEIPVHYGSLIDRLGPVQTSVSRFREMAETAAQTLRSIDPYGRNVFIYKGSLFTIRAVLPNVDATDERPTLVERDGHVISVLSGKICTAVTVAEALVKAELASL